MKVSKAINELLVFGDDNQIQNIIQRKEFFRLFKKDYGHKDVLKLTPLDIYSFFEKRIANYKQLLKPSSKGWENRYQGRYQKGIEKKLPWELKKPEKAFREFLRETNFKQRKVLEIGCGNGLHSVYMAKAGFEVTGVDISKTAIKVAKERAKDAGVKCSFLVADIFDIDLGNQQFDLILDKHYFHIIPVPYYHKYKTITHQHLVQNGLLYIITHNPSHFVSAAQDLYLGLFSRLLKFICDEIFVNGFSKKDISFIFSDKFEIQKSEIINSVLLTLLKKK